MPIKTVIFTDVKKFDGNTRRMFHPHEYIQSAGRAGRRGIDTVGNVIHLPNLYKDVSLLEFKKMLLGKPQRLVSKFKVSYDLIFNLINAKNSKQINPQDYINFCQQSMIQNELNSQITEISKEIDEASVQEEKMSEQLKILKTPTSVFEKYNELTELIEISKNKKQKQYQRELQTLTQNNINFTKDLKHYESLDKQREHIQNLKNDLHNTNDFIVSQVVTILDKLTEETFVKIDETEKLHITHKSRYAANLREVPCMVFAEFLDSDNVKNLTTIEHVSLFSCFTDINVNEERKSLGISSSHREMFRTAMSFIKDSINKYEDFETLERINTGTNYHIHYDLLDYIGDWCKATTIEDCKLIIQEVEKNKDIFIGDFVKAIIKINNIASEVERVAEFVGNIELLEKMKEIPHITLKYVATNQSLYL
jgi:superfamily II RNA helicase